MDQNLSEMTPDHFITVFWFYKYLQTPLFFSKSQKRTEKINLPSPCIS